MGLEGEHDRRQAEFAGLSGQQRKQGLVAEMHAIEVADGEHRSRVGVLGNPAVNLHKRLKKPQL